MSIVIIQTSCPDATSAESIATDLINQGLAACVSRIPGVISTYRWQGELQVDGEELLLIKTTMQRKDAVFSRVQQLHPYELPELIVVEVAAVHGPYRDWIAAAVAAP